MKRANLAWGLLAATVLTAFAGRVYASNQIAQSEGLACTVCHDKPGSKLLTDQGKYYELMRSLDGYREVNAAFGSCTGCHVKKPGSKQLTRTGRQFASVVRDMQGLRIFLAQNHPSIDRKWIKNPAAAPPKLEEKPPR